MGERYRLCVLGLLFLGTAASVACGNAEPAALTLPATAQAVTLSAEPDAIVPEFVRAPSCATQPPFDLRFVVRLGGPSHIMFRRVRFRFEDRLGNTILPQVALDSRPLPPSSLAPSAGPVPTPSGLGLPSASPVPIPSAATFQGLVTSFGSARQLPIALRLDCGVFSTGTLLILAEFDDRGRSLSTEVRIPVR